MKGRLTAQEFEELLALTGLRRAFTNSATYYRPYTRAEALGSSSACAYLTGDEASLIYGYAVATLRRLARIGRLRWRHIGANVFIFDAADVERYAATVRPVGRPRKTPPAEGADNA